MGEGQSDKETPKHASRLIQAALLSLMRKCRRTPPQGVFPGSGDICQLVPIRPQGLRGRGNQASRLCRSVPRGPGRAAALRTVGLDVLRTGKRRRAGQEGASPLKTFFNGNDHVQKARRRTLALRGAQETVSCAGVPVTHGTDPMGQLPSGRQRQRLPPTFHSFLLL